MKQLFENFRSWVNEQSPPTPQKMQLSFGRDAQCSFYSPEVMKKIGFPMDKTGSAPILHSFHLTLPVKNDKGTIAWIGRAYDKQGRPRFYGAAPKSGGMTTGAAQLIKFESGLLLPVDDDLEQALTKILSKAGLKLDQVELPSDAGKIPQKFAEFSLEIASGEKPVNYCKSPTKTTQTKQIEYDKTCNQQLVLKAKQQFSKRLPGVPLKHADDGIIISICKIQRMLNKLGLKVDIDGIIGPQTVGALQKAYTQLKPSRKNTKKSAKPDVKSTNNVNNNVS